MLLDTDVWSVLFARSTRTPDARTETWRNLLVGCGLVIATQTKAEVLAGLAINDLGAKRRESILSQLAGTSRVPVTEDVIVAYADLTADCKRAGHALYAKQHTGDRWVAATAIAVGVPLLAGDGIYAGAPGLEILTDSAH
ncbi:PIN domain-containing protein [Occultella aeris]|uniref:PIN domain-containing protein n=1 Tax=Occultella aeris TaxID=2761496 RepID=UPI0018D2FDC0|nr:PIN domain-containing protein [Occultella aeris]